MTQLKRTRACPQGFRIRSQCVLSPQLELQGSGISAPEALLSFPLSQASCISLLLLLLSHFSRVRLCASPLFQILFPYSSVQFSPVAQSCPTLCMRWPKYWSFNFSISPSKDPRHDEDLREPLVRRQGSQVSMRVARGPASRLERRAESLASPRDEA